MPESQAWPIRLNPAVWFILKDSNISVIIGDNVGTSNYKIKVSNVVAH